MTLAALRSAREPRARGRADARLAQPRAARDRRQPHRARRSRGARRRRRAARPIRPIAAWRACSSRTSGRALIRELLPVARRHVDELLRDASVSRNAATFAACSARFASTSAPASPRASPRDEDRMKHPAEDLQLRARADAASRRSRSTRPDTPQLAHVRGLRGAARHVRRARSRGRRARRRDHRRGPRVLLGRRRRDASSASSSRAT